MNANDPFNLLRPVIRNLQGYSTGRLEASELAKRDDWVRLDGNENPWTHEGICPGSNLYPEPQPIILKNALGKLYNVDPHQILLSRGSEEIPDILVRSFCQPGREGIVICPPTFAMYEIAATLNESPIRRVPLRADHGYDLDVDAILRGWQAHEKLLFIPSPCVPLGHLMPREQIMALIEGLAQKAIVVLDEAYVEFTEQPSWAEQVQRFPNLMVLRTLSKAWALAGARLGALISTPKIVERLTSVLPPFPISAPVIETIMRALSDEGIKAVSEWRTILVAERERMTKAFGRIPSIKKTFPSDSNFLLVQTEDATIFLDRCRDGGILVRNRHNDLPDTVRITIGKPAENDRLLRILQKDSGL